MKRACLAVILVAASSGAASAGTSLGLGIGTGPGLDSDKLDLEADGRSKRGLLGFRFGNFAVEGAVGGFDSLRMDGVPYDAYQASASGKVNITLGNNFEAFGRLGVHRTWLNPEGKPQNNAVGNGWLAGGGFEYRVNLGVSQGSIWVDYQRTEATLAVGNGTFELTTGMWTLGLSVGI